MLKKIRAALGNIKVFFHFISKPLDSQSPCLRWLDMWTNVQIGIERRIEGHCWREPLNTPDFQKLINASVGRLLDFHNCLLGQLARRGGKDVNDPLRRLFLFTAFHNAMFITSTRDFVRRESFCTFVTPPFLDPELPLFHLGECICSTLNNTNDSERSIEWFFAKYFMFLDFMFNAAVFSDFGGEKHIGVFLQMPFERPTLQPMIEARHFQPVVEKLSLSLRDLRETDDLAVSARNLTEIMLGQYVDLSGSASWEEKLRTFIRRYGNKPIDIDPLTWHLYSILRRALVLGAKMPLGKKTEFIGRAKQFGQAYLKLITAFSEKGKVDYDEIFLCEFSFIQFLTSRE